jgi:hypothetical protein
VLDVDIVGAWSNQGGGDIGYFSGFRLHASEGNVGFGYFILALYLKVVGSCIDGVVPGPTLGFTLEMCWGFYPLNTNAIKFIIIRIILYN